MSKFDLDLVRDDLLIIGFGDEKTSNDLIIKEAVEKLEKVGLVGGKLLKINGAGSIPVVAAIVHKVMHLYGAIAVFDPKLEGYVVSVSHSSDYEVGQILESSWGIVGTFPDKRKYILTDGHSDRENVNEVLEKNKKDNPEVVQVVSRF